MGGLKLALDKRTNKTVGIYDVETGSDCNCKCPVCDKDFEAKNRNKSYNSVLKKGQNEAHFAHASGESDCPGAQESMLHKLAKEVLIDHKKICVPSFKIDNKVYARSTDVTFDQVLIEKKVSVDGMGHIKPDAIGGKGASVLFIEFYKTHKVDEDKIEKIRSLNVCCIEVNVNSVLPLDKLGSPNVKGLRLFFEMVFDHTVWLHHSNEREFLLQKKEDDLLFRIEQIKQEIIENATSVVDVKRDLKKGRVDNYCKFFDDEKVLKSLGVTVRPVQRTVDHATRLTDVTVICPDPINPLNNPVIGVDACHYCSRYRGINTDKVFCANKA